MSKPGTVRPRQSIHQHDHPVIAPTLLQESSPSGTRVCFALLGPKTCPDLSNRERPERLISKSLTATMRLVRLVLD
jgi:hypothetical protein